MIKKIAASVALAGALASLRSGPGSPVRQAIGNWPDPMGSTTLLRQLAGSHEAPPRAASRIGNWPDPMTFSTNIGNWPDPM